MHYLICSWSLSSLKHLLSFRCLFHYGSSRSCSQESRHRFFSVINPVLHVYLDVSPASLSALAESKLIWVWSSLRSQRLDFLSLVCLPLCCTGSEQTGLSQWSTPGSFSSQIPTVAALNPFICEWEVNWESLTDLPSALCGLLFTLNLSWQGYFSGLCVTHCWI